MRSFLMIVALFVTVSGCAPTADALRTGSVPSLGPIFAFDKILEDEEWRELERALFDPARFWEPCDAPATCIIDRSSGFTLQLMIDAVVYVGRDRLWDPRERITLPTRIPPNTSSENHVLFFEARKRCKAVRSSWE